MKSEGYGQLSSGYRYAIKWMVADDILGSAFGWKCMHPESSNAEVKVGARSGWLAGWLADLKAGSKNRTRTHRRARGSRRNGWAAG